MHSVLHILLKVVCLFPINGMTQFKFHNTCPLCLRPFRVTNVFYLSKITATRKGPAKLGNIVAETLLRTQMFPSLAARETYVAETNFAAWKQKMFSPEVKNIFVSRTQILRPQHMFPSLATIETMLISFQ